MDSDPYAPTKSNIFGLQLRSYEDEDEEEDDDWSVADAAVESKIDDKMVAIEELPGAAQLRHIAEKQRFERLEDENLDLREVCNIPSCTLHHLLLIFPCSLWLTASCAAHPIPPCDTPPIPIIPHCTALHRHLLVPSVQCHMIRLYTQNVEVTDKVCERCALHYTHPLSHTISSDFPNAD